MNGRRMIELIVFLLIILGICVSVMFADAFADKPIAYEHCGEVTEMVAQPFEDPQEGEKIEAAIDWHYIEDVTLTAYCPCVSCCGKDDGITATGTQAQHGVTIAVDPDVIPLGAWVEIDGRQYHAEDVGGGVNGNHIDVYFDNHDDAVAFGRQYANVRWYE